jgi:Zn-dependent peptidase ImmA (M78 family)/plasmid maintenance system antidote protein VapI
MADALGFAQAEFDDLIVGKRRLTEANASILAEHLGSTARFWLARDKAYVLDLARLDAVSSQDRESSWLASMPTSSMKKLGWVEKSARSRDKLKAEVLSFFGCGTLREWGERYSSGVGAVAFRTSLSLASDGMATLVWLRAGEIAVAGRETPRFDREAFRRILPIVKKLSAFKRPSVFLPRLVEACRQVGVTVATARTPDGCRASGASWFDGAGNPVILLSFRYLSEDHFWFTFFHEAAHIILHGQTHIDGEGGVTVMGSDTERQEREANAFAQELLFPAELREELDRRGFRPKAIMSIARAADVTSGIIVGQLEKAGTVRPGQLSFLKHRYRWTDNPHIPELVN